MFFIYLNKNRNYQVWHSLVMITLRAVFLNKSFFLVWIFLSIYLFIYLSIYLLVYTITYSCWLAVLGHHTGLSKKFIHRFLTTVFWEHQFPNRQQKVSVMLIFMNSKLTNYDDWQRQAKKNFQKEVNPWDLHFWYFLWR